ncbi:HpcH/HpaI aldolase family protein [Ruegeria sp.]|uniref:HpcH/HpaI aldolase family protein n=1 Tax=Ruegeria sp. TaxID=1879320 RepID=UPI003C7DB9FA
MVRSVTASGRASRFGRVKDYLRNADKEICVLVQIETLTALENLEEIASTPGVDGVFVGPADLAASMGHIGIPSHPDVQSAIHSAVDVLNRLGKPAGILSMNDEDSERYIDWGFSFVAVGSDLSLLARSSDNLARRFQEN